MQSGHRQSLGHIDELLTMIFSYLDDRELVRAACVCKHWSEIALDTLWFEVTDLKRALSVLAPFALKPEQVSVSSAKQPGAYAFKRPIAPMDWQRFQRYSGRVRRLHYDQHHLRPSMDKPKRPIPLHSKVLDDLIGTRPTTEIFPNLQSIIWYSSAPERRPLYLAFMHRRVKHLGLHLHKSEPPFLPDYLRQICMQCGDVTSLELRFQYPIQQLENDVSVLLQGLSRLQKVSVPVYCLTSRLFVELSRLKHLSAIALIDPARADPGNRGDVAHFLPVIGNDAFPALRSLSFSAQIADATQLLRTAAFFSELTEMHIKSVVTATPLSLYDLFAAVRDHCPSLLELSVDYIIAPDSPLTSPPPPVTDRPTIATFRPLFSARSLRSFDLRWDYALNLCDDDMDEFASSWPSLQSLQLNSEPVPEAHGPVLSLRALLPFARHCPDLRYLGLHIDARTVPSLRTLRQAGNIPRFRRLETIAVGLSAITKPEPATLFLSQLLPVGCSVRCGLRWPDAFDMAMEHAFVPGSVRTEMSACWKRWNEVTKLLPIATKARMEEKARIDALEKQMVALELSRREDRRRLSWLEREVQDLRERTGRTP